jgi:hypothetical protein
MPGRESLHFSAKIWQERTKGDMGHGKSGFRLYYFVNSSKPQRTQRKTKEMRGLREGLMRRKRGWGGAEK